MQAERWRQIDEIFHAALQVEQNRRAAFLDDTCSGDESLRLELERLLAHHNEAETFLESAALEVAARALAPAGEVSGEPGNSATTLMGQTISHYRILSHLGSGGMGVVCEAEDILLGRRVALKFLPGNLARDPKALERFEREARAASSLNHPNICTIYGVEQHNQQRVIVMELLEGETLKERIRQGPVPWDEFLNFALQICEALEAAHARRIIHRDIKPANIFVVGTGRIKILDFGLAKMTSAPLAEYQSGDESITQDGAILGTASYMSPEQARGEELDSRSDLFSLGVVLYEMATARQPFARKSAISTIDAILNLRPPAPATLNTALPPGLDTIIARMLEKDRALRYQHAVDVRTDLKHLNQASDSRRAPASAKSREWKAIVAVAIAALAFIAAGYLYFHRTLHGTPKLTDRDTIVLADFVNKTGDPVFDDALRQGLSVELQQSPFLSVISDQRVRQTLGLMGQPKDARLTPEIAQQICERTASAAILEGSISSLGSQYVLGLRARSCNTGNILDQEQVQAARREDVLNSLSQIARKFRTRVGESLAMVEKHSTPLAEATTSSLEALKAYTTGIKLVVSSGGEAGIHYYQRAVEIDPKFALAYAGLGLSSMGVLSVENTTKAWQLRDRVSDRERFFIDFMYERQVMGNLEKAYQTLELWLRTYPRGDDPNALDLLTGVSTRGTGRFERAIEACQEKLAANPNFIFAYEGLASTYFFTDRFPEAESMLQRASARKLELPDLLILRYNIALLKGDREQMGEAVGLARGKHEAEHWMAHEEALALARAGRLQAARRSSSRAVDLALQEGEPEAAASYQAARAVWEGAYGNAGNAKRNVMAALALSKRRDIEYAAGLGLALSGNASQSQGLADDIEKRFPEDTFVKFTYVPVLRALGALEHGKPADSVDRLQIALRYELAPNGLNFNRFYLGGLHSAWVRGQALMADHKYAEAAAEFQKILDHRGIVAADPIGALAHLQLGRTFALSGDKAKAKAAYQDFLTLWKEADPDIPILRQARTEYAKL
jgi:eukaryotic-like serine/threonine-protein kinase